MLDFSSAGGYHIIASLTKSRKTTGYILIDLKKLEFFRKGSELDGSPKENDILNNTRNIECIHAEEADIKPYIKIRDQDRYGVIDDEKHLVIKNAYVICARIWGHYLIAFTSGTLYVIKEEEMQTFCNENKASYLHWDDVYDSANYYTFTSFSNTSTAELIKWYEARLRGLKSIGRGDLGEADIIKSELELLKRINLSTEFVKAFDKEVATDRNSLFTCGVSNILKKIFNGMTQYNDTSIDNLDISQGAITIGDNCGLIRKSDRSKCIVTSLNGVRNEVTKKQIDELGISFDSIYIDEADNCVHLKGVVHKHGLKKAQLVHFKCVESSNPFTAGWRLVECLEAGTHYTNYNLMEDYNNYCNLLDLTQTDEDFSIRTIDGFQDEYSKSYIDLMNTVRDTQYEFWTFYNENVSTEVYSNKSCNNLEITDKVLNLLKSLSLSDILNPDILVGVAESEIARKYITLNKYDVIVLSHHNARLTVEVIQAGKVQFRQHYTMTAPIDYRLKFDTREPLELGEFIHVMYSSGMITDVMSFRHNKRNVTNVNVNSYFLKELNNVSRYMPLISQGFIVEPNSEREYTNLGNLEGSVLGYGKCSLNGKNYVWTSSNLGSFSPCFKNVISAVEIPNCAVIQDIEVILLFEVDTLKNAKKLHKRLSDINKENGFATQFVTRLYNDSDIEKGNLLNLLNEYAINHDSRYKAYLEGCLGNSLKYFGIII